ncbi:MAG: BamA/TamA family outer membrane protein [Xanthomonadales bacterium]|nr:BamA/TamA family outer membrane protein [Xanthomonadales bacterium]
MKRFFIIPSVLILIGWFAPSAMASQAPAEPRVGLALSGGGARGGAHIGVLEALEEMGIGVDYIAGTSMGAVIGSMYASGYSAAEIREVFETMDWEWALSDKPERVDWTMRSKELESQFLVPLRVGLNKGKIQLPLGAIEGQHLDQVLREILLPVVETRDFDDLPIPFRAVATDLASGEAVVLTEGSLPDAVRASMSVPGVFSPVEIHGRLLVDGGMANNLPVNIVREMGADIVIAVDISSQMLSREQLTSVLSVTEQLTNFLTRRTTDEQIERLGPGDYLLVPDLGGFSSADFLNAPNIIEKGAEAAFLPELALRELADVRPARTIEPPDPVAGEVTVEFVELDNRSVLTDDIILSRLDVQPGDTVDFATLDRNVDTIYGLDVFRSVTYSLEQNDEGETGLRVKAPAREWGPNYLQFGLELSSNFSGDSDFILGAAYTRNALNRLGGELRLIGKLGREDELSIDFYQPVDSKANWFTESEVYWSRENYRLWEGDRNVAGLEVSGLGGSVGFGRNFSTTDRLRLSYVFGRGNLELVTGDPEFADQYDQDLEVGELEFQYIHDSLDSIWFPTSGMQHRLHYLHATEGLGADSDYRQVLVNGTLAFSIGANTGALNYELGYSLDDAASIERWYRLGGFGRLSGLAPDQLLGQHVALGTLAFYRRLTDWERLSAFAGATIEAGNVWDDSDSIAVDDLRYSGSLFVGAQTPLGPVYVAVGYSDSHDFAAYFYLGNPFRVGRFD